MLGHMCVVVASHFSWLADLHQRFVILRFRSRFSDAAAWMWKKARYFVAGIAEISMAVMPT